jgi:hypothetical protein
MVQGSTSSRRILFSGRAEESFALGQFLRHIFLWQETQPGFTVFPEGALLRYFVGARSGSPGSLILEDQGKEFFCEREGNSQVV